MNSHIGEIENSEQWAPISDLMAVLMLIFMFVAIVFIRTVVIAETTHREECDKIYQVLKSEFGRDFANWDVKLLKDLTIRFRNPEILFETGEDQIRPRFADILRNFFPRYMDVVRSKEASGRHSRDTNRGTYIQCLERGARRERCIFQKHGFVSKAHPRNPAVCPGTTRISGIYRVGQGAHHRQRLVVQPVNSDRGWQRGLCAFAEGGISSDDRILPKSGGLRQNRGARRT